MPIRGEHDVCQRLAAALAVLSVLATTLAASAGTGSPTAPLRVFAAASLTEIAADLAADYDGARVELVFGGSSALARQIRDGAPADVFLSASADWIDALTGSGAIEGRPLVFARNRLVCAGRRGTPLRARGVHDPATLLAALGPADRIAIADEGVPAGEYARDALRSAGLLGAFRRRLVGLRDVRAVLHAVEQGELPAGFVYATDAALAAVDVLFVVDPASHRPVEYTAAVLHDASSPDEARRFVAYLGGETARSLLTRAGFALP